MKIVHHSLIIKLRFLHKREINSRLDHQPRSGNVAGLSPDIRFATIVHFALALLAAVVLVALFVEQGAGRQLVQALLHFSVVFLFGRLGPVLLQPLTDEGPALEPLGSIVH